MPIDLPADVAHRVSITVALYCRISVDREGRREGVEAQEQWGREYAAEHWPGAVIRVFSDNNLSAARDDRREGYDALRAAVSAGEITHVWTVEQSRLERRKAEWFELAAELIRAGIDEVHSRRDGLIRLDDIGSDVRAIYNARYIVDLKKKVRDKMEVLAREGRPSGAVVFGYRHGRDEQGRKALFVVEEEAEAVRWAADAFLSGRSMTSIADELTARGFTGAKGKQLRVSSISRIFSAPTIAGRRIHRGVDVGPGNWVPILDMDTWLAVRTRMSSVRVVRRRDGRDHPVSTAVLTANRGRTGRQYILTSGFAVCKVCDAPLVGCKIKQATGRIAYLRCQTSQGGGGCVGIPMEPVEKYVMDWLFAELEKPEFLALIEENDSADRRKKILAAMTALDTRRAEAGRMWATTEMDTAAYRSAKEVLDRREAKLQAELAGLPAPEGGVTIEEAREGWLDLPLDIQRAFLHRYITSITVNRWFRGCEVSDRVDIDPRYKLIN